MSVKKEQGYPAGMERHRNTGQVDPVVSFRLLLRVVLEVKKQPDGHNPYRVRKSAKRTAC